MARRLRYSERKTLAETGSLGDLTDRPSTQLRQAVVHALDRARNARWSFLSKAFADLAQDICEEHFGWEPGMHINAFPLLTQGTEDFLDYVEILVEAGKTDVAYTAADHYKREGKGWPSAEVDLNRLFERHRFGYRIENGEVHAIASPALEDAVVGPALLAVRRPGWEQVERSFKEALVHQRAGPSENDDALTAAHAALEAALKAAGLKGDRLSALAKSLRGSGLVPSQLESVPDLLDDLLKRSSAIRDSESDAHGKRPGAAEVPQALVNLAIHWTGAFIVYLADQGGRGG